LFCSLFGLHFQSSLLPHLGHLTRFASSFLSCLSLCLELGSGFLATTLLVGQSFGFLGLTLGEEFGFEAQTRSLGFLTPELGLKKSNWNEKFSDIRELEKSKKQLWVH
jgi:hypothetical protein